MDLKREILAVNAMFGRCVDMELRETELVATKGCCTVYYNLDGGIEIFEQDSLLRDFDGGLFSSKADRAICNM